MQNNIIDLRSDTVTIPTEEMRQAMCNASVGDDVYGDDPTVNQLEALAAEMCHMEAGLFVPSGVMGNELALFTHIQRGEEVILPDNCHIVTHEGGAAAIIAGAQLRCLPLGEDGEMPLASIEKAIRKDTDNIHYPGTGLITYENADSDGKVRSLDYMKNVKELAERFQLPVHIDGARIFNAATFLKQPVWKLTEQCNSISICLSKGLCAPIGSVLLGSKTFIAAARRKRKILGGGMRQAGIIAAAGILALEKMTTRLQEDHEHALYFAKRLSEVPGIDVEMGRVQINMVFFRLKEFPVKGQQLISYLEKKGIRINGEEEGVMRFVTHYYVSKEDIDFVVDTLLNYTADGANM